MTAEKILENKYTEKEIIDEIENIKLQLNKTRMNFEMCTDEILIDSYIYEIISLNKKYQYFLRLAKNMVYQQQYSKNKKNFYGKIDRGGLIIEF